MCHTPSESQACLLHSKSISSISAHPLQQLLEPAAQCILHILYPVCMSHRCCPDAACGCEQTSITAMPVKVPKASSTARLGDHLQLHLGCPYMPNIPAPAELNSSLPIRINNLFLYLCCRGYASLWDWFGTQFQSSFAQWPLALGIGKRVLCVTLQLLTCSAGVLGMNCCSISSYVACVCCTLLVTYFDCGNDVSCSNTS